ncbi:hypothetical protein C0Q70_03163 [Pomacea canaliculata]|uniref:Uncharacterized protein n=1 Tax=Pomacea canaliculata TaxID=400727 RepID=A0A2T7PRZ5_POMCA|nr:hypothetical protein C0Q70_03163 [Pomacea canaliculata]
MGSSPPPQYKGGKVVMQLPDAPGYLDSFKYTKMEGLVLWEGLVHTGGSGAEEGLVRRGGSVQEEGLMPVELGSGARRAWCLARVRCPEGLVPSEGQVPGGPGA